VDPRITPAYTLDRTLREWINNDRRLRRIIDQMGAVAAKAAEIRLTQTDPKV
jgi:hypothetical protein